ncbi:hypothetical protein QHH03_30015 [Aphanizomenon sp. 202]|nr:hypothetical protein [Aphanizomenon sp. 202]
MCRSRCRGGGGQGGGGRQRVVWAIVANCVFEIIADVQLRVPVQACSAAS